MSKALWSTLVAAALLAGGAGSARGEDGWWDTEPRHVPFDRVLQDPIGYRDVTVVLTLQFDRKQALFNPYFTTFTPDRFYNFTAWPDSAELWEKEQFLKPYPFFFISRADPFAAGLKDLPSRTRLTCTAVVRTVFRGEPWIEITTVKREDGAVSPATVRAAFQGMEKFDKGDFDGAIASYRAALATKPGAGPEASLHRRIARVHWKRQELKECRAELDLCLAVNPEDRDARSLQEVLAAAEKRVTGIPTPIHPAMSGKREPVKPAAEALNEPAPAEDAPKPAPRPEPRKEPVAPPKPEPVPAKPAPPPAAKPAEPPPPPPPPPPAPEPEPQPAPEPEPAPEPAPPPPAEEEKAPEPEPEPEPAPPPPPKKRPAPPR